MLRLRKRGKLKVMRKERKRARKNRVRRKRLSKKANKIVSIIVMWSPQDKTRQDKTKQKSVASHKYLVDEWCHAQHEQLVVSPTHSTYKDMWQILASYRAISTVCASARG